MLLMILFKIFVHAQIILLDIDVNKTRILLELTDDNNIINLRS